MLKKKKKNDRSKFEYNTEMTEGKMYSLLCNGYFDKGLKDFPKGWQQAHI